MVRRFVNRRFSVFPQSAHSGVRLTGKWDETLYSASDVNAYQEASSILAFTDVKGTKGSFVQDIDGNVLLDMCGTEGLPLGHNHDSLTSLSDNKSWDQYIINSNLDAASVATSDFHSRVNNVLGSIAPAHLQAITLTGGRNASESALLDAFAQREGKVNQLSALGFAGANHGHGLAMTQFAHPNMSLQADWPALEYSRNESQVLDRVRSSIQSQRATKPVAAVLVEPVNWTTGESMSDSLID